MPKILVSYRREDSAAYAGRLADRLRERFGAENVFVDIDTIRPGQDFVESIEKSVGSCDALVAVIGRTWLSSTDATGRRRLDNPDDFVRMEIATALERGIRVIPTLVGGATVPSASDLPEALSKLTRRQALEISDTRFHQDVDRLVEALADMFAPEQPVDHARTGRAQRSRASRGDWRWIAAAALVVLAGLTYWIFGRAGWPGGGYPAATTVSNPESHDAAAPRPMEPGRIYYVRLESHAETYFKLSEAVTAARIVVDSRCASGELCGLRADVSILDDDGVVIQNRAVSLIIYDLASRQISTLSRKDPTAVQIKVLNPSDVAIDYWLTAVNPGASELVPFFGKGGLRQLEIGDTASGILDARGWAGYVAMLTKGNYNATLELSDAERRQTSLRGYAAVVPAAGGAESVVSSIIEFNVSFRKTETLSVKADGLHFVRVQNQGEPLNYIFKLTRR